ncbi:MAG: STAS domain-containing protein [Leptospiraceae bacterium]|nr:STAS domain-containing protein [Leptospiraceae bacterium]
MSSDFNEEAEILSVVIQSGELLAIRLNEDLKMENAPEFFEGFQQALEDTHSTVVVDFSRIRFVDSSGVGILLKCAHSIRNRGGRFRILGLSRALLSVFKLAGLLKIFEVMENEQAQKEYPALFE